MKMKQLTVAMITLLLTASCSEKQQDYPFRNPELPLEERARRNAVVSAVLPTGRQLILRHPSAFCPFKNIAAFL